VDDDPWAFRAYGALTGGRREDFYYILADSSLPTLERVRWALPTTPKRTRLDWTAIAIQLSDSLTSRGRGLDDRLEVRLDTRLLGGASHSIVHLTGDSIVANVTSLALERDQADSTSWLGFSSVVEDPPDFGPNDSADGIAKELAAHWPGLAAAMRRAPASLADSTVVRDALVRSEAGSVGQEEQDKVRWAAHKWCHLALSTFKEDEMVCVPCRPLESAFGRWGLKVFAGHYGGWYTNGAFVAPLLRRAGSNRWTDLVFLKTLYGDFDLSRSDSCRGTFISCQPFQLVMDEGEAFLRDHPRSSVATEVRLLAALAHETGWSLSKFRPSPDAGDPTSDVGSPFDPTSFTLGAPLNRSRAIELYEDHLRLNPLDPRNRLIKRRLARIRLDIDTGCRAFVNWGIC